MKQLLQKILICLFLTISLLLYTNKSFGQYNTLAIPDTLSGTTFNLRLVDTVDQICATGNQTITYGISEKFGGPTLIFHQGDTVHVNIHNELTDTATIHWHGSHLPAIMDGGPHQTIPPGTIWQPYWKVTNNASTLWYHSHLHNETAEQVTDGLAGLIIVRDTIESALALPRTYGVDDIPMALTDRRFDSTTNQFELVPYGDSMMVNGTIRPQYSVPAQVVRFRLLDANIERSYNIGFSDGRTFYVIASDGGLIDAPVAVTRYQLNAGERIEILVNFDGENGTSVNMEAFNSEFNFYIPGGEKLSPPNIFANYLGHKDFTILHINVTAPTANPITTIPSTLTTVTRLDTATANITRHILFSDSLGDTNSLGPTTGLINHLLFNMSYISYYVPLGNTEIWEILSTSVGAHVFHIHDVQFNIVSVDGVAPVPAQAGWKDVVYIPADSDGIDPHIIKFITQFNDYADSIHPYMFHCHIAMHEDEGMMSQFVVTPVSTGINNLKQVAPDFSIYPNPANNKVFVSLSDPTEQVYYIKIKDMQGRTMYMLPRPQISHGIDISALAAGTYLLQLTDDKTKITTTKKFIKVNE